MKPEKLLTSRDEILIGEARMVHVVNGGSEDGRKHLKRGEDRLKWKTHF
jgi:hypothetical protein